MLTQNDIETLDWDKNAGLIPAVIEDAVSGRVLMLAYMNRESLQKTLETKRGTFFSRSKGRLWTKGETSGNFLNLVDLAADCDKDTLLVTVNAEGPACHLGTTSCFGDLQSRWQFLRDLEVLLASRKGADPATSYTASLYARGTKRIAQKVGEEGVETALAATVHDREELRNEAADLVYHLLVLLQAENLELADVIDILRERHAAREAKAAPAK